MMTYFIQLRKQEKHGKHPKQEKHSKKPERKYRRHEDILKGKHMIYSYIIIIHIYSYYLFIMHNSIGFHNMLSHACTHTDIKREGKRERES